ncbi:MAG: L,D-transpeptidase family protein [Gammaproteobacteria bacterium]
MLLCALMLLGGCQNKPQLHAWEQPVFVQQPQIDSIATHEFQLSGEQNIVGELAAIDTRENDNLLDIARHFGLGYNDITIANAGVSPWTPGANRRVLLPLRFILPDAARKGIVLNLANMRLFFYPPKQPESLYTYPVGIGRQGWSTPLGLTRIISKRANPVWTVPESIRREHAAKGDPLPKVVRAGPDNPLGKFAMPLGFSGYLIHGTNKPAGIGMQVSHGCVQLYPEDIEALFGKTSVGTPVRIVHQPYLTAWDGDMLFVEAHQPLKKWVGQKKRLKKKLLDDVARIAKEKQRSVDWAKVERILERADGIPTPVLADSPEIAELADAAPQLRHPEQFYGQPMIAELKDSDWSILAATFDNERQARQLAVMLNHQGPPIPARDVQTADGAYQVIAGPFKNKKETRVVAERIKTDFETDAKPLHPQVMVE